MATPDECLVKADHVIIWLDEHIAVPGNNESTKQTLEDNANVNLFVRSPSAELLDQVIQDAGTGMDIDTRNRLIKDPLHMFANEHDCIKFINECFANKQQPFLMTSGRKGPSIVPRVHQQLSGKIYVFCGDREYHKKWTDLYEKDIQVYDDDRGVFVSILCDIAAYYITKGQDDTCNLPDANQYFEWSIKLYKGATKIDGVNRDAFIEAVNIEVQEKYDKVAPME